MSTVRPTLSRTAHDRAAHRRTDEKWLVEAWPTARVLTVDAGGFAPVQHTAETAELVFTSGAEVDPALPRTFLGEGDGVVYFSVPGERGDDWESLRITAGSLDDLGAGLMACAVALAAWHASHTHCPRCGAPTEPVSAGWSTRCTNDGSMHFPRTDPAVIMLIHDGADKCVLGRGEAWPTGRFSILAGFVEAGESAEAAVVREVDEEVGLAVTDVRYVASQPWPFPASLMLGYTALGDSTQPVVLQDGELAEAGWFSRDEIRAARVWGSDSENWPAQWPTPLRALPGNASIANAILTQWLAEG
ncbi:MAG: NAD(+) diphosphatase [Jatrophihabitans sp.]